MTAILMTDFANAESNFARLFGIGGMSQANIIKHLKKCGKTNGYKYFSFVVNEKYLKHISCEYKKKKIDLVKLADYEEDMSDYNAIYRNAYQVWNTEEEEEKDSDDEEVEPWCYENSTKDTIADDKCYCSAGGCVLPTFEDELCKNCDETYTGKQEKYCINGEKNCDKGLPHITTLYKDN